MIVVDTNLLVYAHRSLLPEHLRARAALDRASREDGWSIALPSVLELWSVVTHPSASGRPSRPDEVRAFLDSLKVSGVRVLSPLAGTDARLLEAAVELDAVGSRIFDLLIAIIARDHGATEIWSHDRHFVALPGLRVVDPLAPA